MSCKTENTAEKSGSDNPLLAQFETPYTVPPFEDIENGHFAPAIQEAIKAHQKEIDAIVANTAKPDFKNTVEALENSGALLTKVTAVFYNLNMANTNPELQAIAQEMAPILAKHNDNIYLNTKLFKKIKQVWEQQPALDSEEAMLLEKKYKAFLRSGAGLEKEKKAQLREINEQLAVLSLQFGDNVLAETNDYALTITNDKDLSGLPETLIQAAKDEANERGENGKWIFTLQNASVMPFLQYADNRDLRKQIWNAYQMRGNNTNKYNNNPILVKLSNLRSQKAKLLGYDNYADYILEERMAKTPEKVYDLLGQLWQPAVNKAIKEEADIKAMMEKDGINDEVKPYDWRYYTEKIREERFNLNEQEIMPYFSLENVREGIFIVTGKLYGLQYRELPDVPKYHEDVTVWEVTEKDGKHLGLVYMDFFARPSKKGGAWMTSYRKQQMENGERIAPVISIVCNFPKPAGTTPALLTFDETSTFFHEFGHALHGLLSNVKYESLAGTSVYKDFVELPSQVMENWAAEPEILKMYAKHYKTGEAIPDALIEKLQQSATFNQGFATVEYLAATYLDLKYHTIGEALPNDVNAFEKEAMEEIGLTAAIIPRYRSTYYNHIFNGGYAAGYYSYIWSGLLDSDAFDAFTTTSLFDSATATSFRTNILEKGGTADPAELYRKFRGAEPSIQPLLRKRGLLNEPE